MNLKQFREWVEKNDPKVKELLQWEAEIRADERARVGDENNWKSFDTAPKDREILVLYPNQNNTVELVYWDKIHKLWRKKGVVQLGIENQQCLWIDVPLLSN